MALAWVTNQPFVTSTIIGATTMEQLEADLGSEGLVLSEEVLAKIEVIHSCNPNPSP